MFFVSKFLLTFAPSPQVNGFCFSASCAPWNAEPIPSGSAKSKIIHHLCDLGVFAVRPHASASGMAPFLTHTHSLLPALTLAHKVISFLRALYIKISRVKRRLDPYRPLYLLYILWFLTFFDAQNKIKHN